MKNDDILYLAVGGVALYLITRKNTMVLPLHPGTAYVPANNYVPQQSQSVVLPLLATAATLVNKIFSPAGSALPNPNNIINLPAESQQSIQTLNDDQLLNTTLPDLTPQFVDAGSNSPTGFDLHNYFDPTLES